MHLINQIFDYALSRDLLPNELKICRFCGQWIGNITLVCNRPILKRHIDLKKRMLRSVELKRPFNYVQIVISILKNIQNSNIFDHRVPFINVMYDILRDIKSFP